MPIETRRVDAADGALLEQLRLTALLDTPSAFARTHAEEAQQSEVDWARLAAERSRGRGHATFFAFEAGVPVGLVGGHRSALDGEVELVSMWTDPAARGRGVAAALVEVVLDWAAGDPVNLWVTRGNEPARRLYERHGFSETGEHKPLPSDPCKDEVRMRVDPARESVG